MSDDVVISPVIRQIMMLNLDNIINHVHSICNTTISNLAREEKEHVTQTKNKIEEYVKQNYRRKITHADMNLHTGISRNPFCRFFQQHYKCTFVEYLTNFRLEKAVIMLKTTNKSMTIVAYECGFESVNWFNNRFKKHKNMPPSMYRAQNKGNN